VLREARPLWAESGAAPQVRVLHAAVAVRPGAKHGRRVVRLSCVETNSGEPAQKNAVSSLPN